MRIVYDISVLGSGLYSQQSRTGVARYIDNLRLALALENEMELSLCAFHSLEEYVQLRVNPDHIDGVGGLDLCPLAQPLAKLAVNAIAKVYPRLSVSDSQQLRRLASAGVLHAVDRLCGDCGVLAPAGADIFHSTYYPLPAVPKGTRNCKRFITVHDLIPILFPQFFGNAKDSLSHRIVSSIRPDDWIVTNSETTKDDLCDYARIDPSRVFVTPLAASDLFFRCTDVSRVNAVKKRYGIYENPYILSVCTLEPRKNLDQVIRSFIQLVQEQHIDDLHLVLTGTRGWDFDKVFNEIGHASELKDRVIVTGYISDDDLTSLYSGAMMFVYPSFYEGFGLPPLEAMQCGVPVITSNTSSLPEVVGDAGIMVDPYDGEALSQAMLEVYSQPSLRERLSVNSLERAALFSWKKCARKTIEAYKTALQR